MSTEITNYKESRAILMKSGLIHWVTKETGEKTSEYLANQKAHSFLRIRELNNITINTAEMEGVYDHGQYEDLCRVKGGEWQCAYRRWHPKKGECHCKVEIRKKEEEDRKRKEEAEHNKPQTPEEIERSREAMIKMNEMAALDGSPIFRSMFLQGRKNGRRVRPATIAEWEKKNGKKADLDGIAIEGITNNQD